MQIEFAKAPGFLPVLVICRLLYNRSYKYNSIIVIVLKDAISGVSCPKVISRFDGSKQYVGNLSGPAPRDCAPGAPLGRGSDVICYASRVATSAATLRGRPLSTDPASPETSKASLSTSVLLFLACTFMSQR